MSNSGLRSVDGRTALTALRRLTHGSQPARTVFLVRSFRDVEAAREYSQQGGEVIAGSVRVSNLLAGEHIDTIPAASVVDAAAANQILEKVDAIASFVGAKMDRVSADEPLRAIIAADVVRVMFRHLSMVYLGRAMRASVMHQVDRRLAPADEVSPTNASANISRSNAWIHYPIRCLRNQRDGVLQFQTETGKKVSAETAASISMGVRLSEYGGVPVFIRNAVEGLRSLCGSRHVKYRYIVKPYSRQSYADQLGLEDARRRFGDRVCDLLTRTVAETESVFTSYRESLFRLLSDYQRAQGAAFNNVGTAAVAGIVAGISKVGIKTSMNSHGGLVPYGEGPRDRVATVLANCVNNTFPAVSELLPRSPLQLKTALSTQEVTKIVRVRSITDPPPRNQEFTIYYAPNFLPWVDCYHGLSTSCFETLSCIEYLAACVRKMDSTTLRIRIKTVATDVAKKGQQPAGRGMLPADVEHLFDRDAGIIDACSGSHSKLMRTSDLVVTEGVTAVMFEALEYRKPLLLLNQSDLRPPSLPSRTLSEVQSSQQRCAVYAGFCDSSLSELIRWIRVKHHDQPLLDEEIRPYVWT